MTTWWSRIAAAMSSRRWLTGSSGGIGDVHNAGHSLPPVGGAGNAFADAYRRRLSCWCSPSCRWTRPAGSPRRARSRAAPGRDSPGGRKPPSGPGPAVLARRIGRPEPGRSAVVAAVVDRDSRSRRRRGRRGPGRRGATAATPRMPSTRSRSRVFVAGSAVAGSAVARCSGSGLLLSHRSWRTTLRCRACAASCDDGDEEVVSPTQRAHRKLTSSGTAEWSPWSSPGPTGRRCACSSSTTRSTSPS